MACSEPDLSTLSTPSIAWSFSLYLSCSIYHSLGARLFLGQSTRIFYVNCKEFPSDHVVQLYIVLADFYHLIVFAFNSFFWMSWSLSIMFCKPSISTIIVVYLFIFFSRFLIFICYLLLKKCLLFWASVVQTWMPWMALLCFHSWSPLLFLSVCFTSSVYNFGFSVVFSFLSENTIQLQFIFIFAFVYVKGQLRFLSRHCFKMFARGKNAAVLPLFKIIHC